MIQNALAVFLLSLSVSASAADKQTSSSVRTTPLAGTIALTFDDGPSPYTPEVLAVLKKYHVKATFFIVGANAAKYPEYLKAIHDEGHVIASHSMTHPMLTKLSNARLEQEIAGPQKVVMGILGIKPLCLRYPFGASNEHVRAAIRAQGIEPVPMGFNSFDYERPGTQKIIDWVLKNLHSKQVVLLHDGYDKREQTVAALPAIIEGAQKKGLGFSTICG